MQKGQAGIWIIVAALVIVIAGGAYYLGRQTTSKPSNSVVTSQTAQPTPVSSPSDASPVPPGAAETANWKTYINTKYGFSFKYPDSRFRHITIMGDTGENFGLYIASRERLPNELEPPDFNINVDVNKTDFNIAQYVYEYFEKPYPDDIKQTTTINNQLWYKFFHSPYKDGELSEVPAIFGYRAVTKNGAFNYILSLHSGDKSLFDKDKELLDKMLTTFKFLK